MINFELNETLEFIIVLILLLVTVVIGNDEFEPNEKLDPLLDPDPVLAIVMGDELVVKRPLELATVLIVL